MDFTLSSSSSQEREVQLVPRGNEPENWATNKFPITTAHLYKVEEFSEKLSDIVCTYCGKCASYEPEHCRELPNIVGFDSREDEDFTGQGREVKSSRLGNHISRGGT